MHQLLEKHADAAGFRLLSKAVQGGSSIVYKAKSHFNDQLLAIKLLNPAHNPARIQREAKAVSLLSHPNIAEYVSVGHLQEHPYLATRWIEGKPLRYFMTDDLKDTSVQMVKSHWLSLIRDIGAALQYAHDQGVVHGDIKPGNVLITKTRQAVLIDFGIGRVSDESTVTAYEELAGTPRYMAPEVIQGQSPTPESDQYQFALLTYELLAGQWPFSMQHPSPATALHHQLYTSPAPLSEIQPGLPATLDAVFNRALHKSFDQRYPNINAFELALTSALEQKTPHRSWRKAAIKTSIIISTSAVLLGNGWSLNLHSKVQPGSTTQLSDTCNLFTNSDFNLALEKNFYWDADNPLLATRIDQSDIDSSPVLRLGTNAVYGLYGVIVPVTANHTYSVHADLFFQEYVHRVDLSISWLDKDWQTIEESEATHMIEKRADGNYSLMNAVAPPMAKFAVPSLYKDASAGTVFVDNVMFVADAEPCEQH